MPPASGSGPVVGAAAVFGGRGGGTCEGGAGLEVWVCPFLTGAACMKPCGIGGESISVYTTDNEGCKQ